MTVSVVIPARNAATTLGETLDSLLAQTCGDWMALVVDDGSTDTTCTLAQSYARRDPRIRLLDDGRASEGASAARNRGIAEATGDWLLFLDADDWIDSAFLERMLGVLTARPGARVAYSACRRVRPDGHAGPFWLSSEVARAPFEVLARQCPVVIHGFLLDRGLVDEIGGFDPALRTCEDWDFWHRLARTGIAFHPVADAVAYYRLRAGSLASDARAMLADARIVIGRAFAADPRVRHPAPRHAVGADPSLGTKEACLGHFALWCAAFDIGDGGQGWDLVLPLPDSGGNIAEACRATILAGLRARARIAPDELLSQDAVLVDAVRGLLRQVERAARRPGLARQLEHMLERDLFQPGAPTARRVIGQTLLVRQDAACLTAIEVPAGVGSLQAEFRVPGREPRWIEVPVFASLARREVAELAIDAMGLRAFVKGARVRRRPGFWVQLVTEAVRQTPAVLRDWRRSRHGLRAHARQVVRRAALTAYGPAHDTAKDHPFAVLLDDARMEAGRVPIPPAKGSGDAGPGTRIAGARIGRGGAEAWRAEVPAHASVDELPILNYHRIATDGPPGLARYRTSPAAFREQMCWLRRRGYHAVTTADLAWHMTSGQPFRGRPVLITFDDGYLDFHETAWPILRAHDLTAEIFIATDHVGGTAQWDAGYGLPAPVMGWDTIRELAAGGIRFGSHMASHSHMDTLSNGEIVREAVRSRALLERALGTSCASIAAPFGEASDRFVRIVARCGYGIGLTSERGFARLDSDPLRLPRIEVLGHWSLEHFKSAVRPASSCRLGHTHPARSGS